MLDKGKIYVRIQVSDIVMTKEEFEENNNTFTLTDLECLNTSLIGYEDEDGNEVDKNGNPL